MTEAICSRYGLPQRWSDRALNIARIAAVAAVAVVQFSTALTSVAFGVMLLSWLASGRALSTLTVALKQPVGAALAIFFVVLALGTLHGPAEWAVRLDSLWGWRKLAYVFILLALFSEERWKRNFVFAFLVTAGVGFCASYLSWLEWIPSDIPGVVFHNHATQGMIFALAVLCCHQIAPLVSRRMRPALLLFGILFALNIVFISPGRSGYLALLAVGAVISLVRFGWRRLPVFAAVGGLIVALAFVVSPVLQERVKLAVWEVENFNPSHGLTSIGFRMVTLENSLELVTKHPVIGSGTGSFPAVYAAHVAAKYSDWRGEATTDPHNQYLFIAVENGLIGLVAFLVFLLAAFLTRGIPASYRWIGVGALTIWILTSLANSHFRTFGEGHLIGLFVGTMLAGGRLRNHSCDTGSRGAESA